MAKRLRKLSLTKVALVPAGANPAADVLLWKAREEQEAPPAVIDALVKNQDEEDLPFTTNQILAQQQLWQQWRPLWSAFCESVWTIIDHEDAAGYASVLLQSVDEFATQARAILTGLNLVEKAAPFFVVCDEVTKAGAVMSAGRKKRLQDAISTLQAILDEAAPKASNDPPTEKGDPMPTAEQEALAKAVQRAEAAEAIVTTLQKNLADQAAVLDEIQKAQDANDPEAMWKGVPEGIRKRQEALEKRLQEADEKSERLEYIEKSKELRHVGMVPDDDWETLRAINKMEAKPKARLLQLLKSANEVIKASSLWKPMGHDQLSEGASAEDRAMALAKSLVADGKAKDVSEGLDQVFKADGNLYAEYQHESRQRSRVK